MKDAEQTSIEVPKPETIAPSVRSKTPSEQSGSSNEPKTSINPMEKRILLEAHQEGIRFLCNKVFGDRLILEQSIQKIKENPDVGEQLLWDLTKNPQSISELAGRKVLGIKNRARKEAEEALEPLNSAIEDFVFTVKYTQENISQSSQIKQRQHQQAQQEKTIQPLSNHEIARKVQQDPSVKQSKREIQFLS
ncbi:BID domain-containing T4SS effector, partial [Bartonella tribocorum]|uniref:BID domain-containing T4SS effector n=1 Tax=Bartonella tribocorum TaxID=85701 RepID=UPI001FD94D38